MTYLNRTWPEQEGYVMMELHTSGYGDISATTPPSAVPEPSAYAMLAAGLGVVRLARCRRA